MVVELISGLFAIINGRPSSASDDSGAVCFAAVFDAAHCTIPHERCFLEAFCHITFRLASHFLDIQIPWISHKKTALWRRSMRLEKIVLKSIHLLFIKNLIISFLLENCESLTEISKKSMQLRFPVDDLSMDLIWTLRSSARSNINYRQTGEDLLERANEEHSSTVISNSSAFCFYKGSKLWLIKAWSANTSKQSCSSSTYNASREGRASNGKTKCVQTSICNTLENVIEAFE